jgi:ribosome recycling factor
MPPLEEIEEILVDCDESMDKCIDSLKRELNRVRTGRANLSVLDGIRVDYYGTATPLNQVAALTVADPRLITVKPWDKNLLADIERSIQAADLGLTPGNDGEIIRLPIPPLTGERRKELVRSVGKCIEDAKIAIRNARRDANDMLKSVDSLPEDDLKKAKKSVQDRTDRFVTSVIDLGTKKETDILEI